MSTRSALAGAVTTAALVTALGSPAAVEAGRDADSRVLGLSLTAFADWDVGDLPDDAVGTVVVRLAVVLMLVTLLCALAGRSRARGAAFLAGWGALVVATAVAGAAASAYEAFVVIDERPYGAALTDSIVGSTNAAATFGLWTGWLVGLAVAVVVRPRPVEDAAPEAAPTPAIRRPTEPPPPWWAPTRSAGGDGAVRPGPTVFLPGGAHAAGTGGNAGTPVAPRMAAPPPVVPEGTYEMTTVSGDPHPSDPDATRPIGFPPPEQEAPRSDAHAGGGDGDGDPGSDAGASGDADVTAAMATDDPDAPRPVRRTDS